MIWCQTHTDIFMIDWERSRGRIVQSNNESTNNKGTLAPISIWRTYFIANEWNEIQVSHSTLKFIHIMEKNKMAAVTFKEIGDNCLCGISI